jgi:hypothetical protein
MAKQIFIDILIVIILPVLAVFGYFYLKTDEGSALLSSASLGATSRPGEGSAELGVKTKAALSELKSIHFEEAFFSEPAFLSLEDFTEQIDATPVGRQYPFITPDELRNMARRSNNNKTSSASSASSATVGVATKNLSGADISTKLNAAKEGVR